MLGRSRFRDRGRGSGVGGANLLNQATLYLGGVAPYHWLDFINNRALYAGADVGNVTGATGYSFTRASDGYYTNADGTLTLFGSGALRRGDRGVLIEGSRTNSVLWSQDFSNAAWTKTSTTLTSGQADPTGGTAAFTLNGSGSFPRIEATAVTTTAAAWTISVFVRRGGSGTIALAFSNVGGADEVGFNLATGAFGTPGANISSTGVEVLNANWWRIWAVSTRTATTAIGRVFSGYPSNASPTIFGFQYELGSFPSSYIPTVAAAATRAADVLTYTAGVSYPLQLWSEFERAVDTGANENLVYLDDGTSNNFARLIVGDVDALVANMFSGGANQGSSSSAATISVGSTVKGSGRYNTNSIRACLAGTLAPEDTVATLAATPTTIYIGSSRFAQINFGYIRRIAVIQGAGTDANLQAMTL